MEYVEGAPIDQYCDQHRLPVERRLQLFCRVCAAVQYAHRNLIVHRDLKPANILVTADGGDRKSTRLNSSHPSISYAVFCLKKKKKNTKPLQAPCNTQSSYASCG